jgi:hypothetical protein
MFLKHFKLTLLKLFEATCFESGMANCRPTPARVILTKVGVVNSITTEKKADELRISPVEIPILNRF